MAAIFVALVGLLLLVCFAKEAVALALPDLQAEQRVIERKIKALLVDEKGEMRPTLSDEDTTKVEALTAELDKAKERVTAAQAARVTIDARRKLLAGMDAPTPPAGAPSASMDDGVERSVVTNVHERSEDDPKRGYKTPRAYIMDVLMAGRTKRVSDRLKPLTVQATAGSDEHGEYSDPYGGFSVPPGFSPDLMKTTAEGDVLGQFVRRVPMTSPSLSFLARVDKTHTTSVSGGFRWYWGSEADTVASSRSEIEKISLVAHTAKGVAYATNELLTDSPLSFAALISDGFAEEYASFISEARLTGTGVGQLLGIRNSDAVIEITKENEQVAATVVIANLLKMLARCWGSDRAVWVANKTLIPQLGVLTINNGVSAVPIFLPRAQESLSDMLLGRPVIYSEHAKALGTAGDISLYNMNEYLEGTLQNLQGQTSIHVRFLENEQTFRFIARKAGAPWWRSVLTPKNGDTLSPFFIHRPTSEQAVAAGRFESLLLKSGLDLLGRKGPAVYCRHGQIAFQQVDGRAVVAACTQP